MDCKPIGNWVSREFDFIPCSAFVRLAGCGISRLNNVDDADRPFSLSRYFFHPRELEITLLIEQHAEQIEACGFWIYDSEPFGLLLYPKMPQRVFYNESWEKLRMVIDGILMKKNVLSTLFH